MMDQGTSLVDPNVSDLLRKSKDAQKLCGWVSAEYRKTKSSRTNFERQWYLNYAFYKGRQNVIFQGAAGAGGLIVPKAAPYRVRSITNRIKPIVRTEISKLTSNKPNASVIPASNEDKDLFAAQAAEQVWESMYSLKKLHDLYTRAAFWTSITGNGFIKDWWDQNKIVKGPDGEQYQGDICYSVVTPFNLFIPDLMEESIEDQSYVLNAYTKPVEWVKTAYGPHMSFEPNVVSSTELIGEGFFRTQSGANRPDSVLVIEAWLKPGAHAMFPQGGMVTVVNDTIVELVEGCVYEYNEYPFTHITHIPTGEFYRDSVINDLVMPQREYNRTRSQIIESKQRMAKPQLMAPIGSVDPKKITTEPGQLIQYRPGLAPPQPLPMQPLPSYVLQELDRIVMDMEDISSQHEVTHGQAPSGVTAATAINYLQEKDDSAMSVTYQSVERAWEKLARHTLGHIVQYWETPRIVNTTGLDGAFDAITLKGSEISTGTDIRMEAGSALPTSKAAKQAFIMDCMRNGWIDPNEGLSLMDMGGVNKLYDKLKIDERQAQRENLRLANTEVNEIFQHQQDFANAQAMAEQAQQQMQTQQMGPQQDQLSQLMPGAPPETANAQQQMAFNGLNDQMQMQSQQQPQIDVGYGQDPNTGAPLLPSQCIVPVNTYDNHQVHIDVHNRYRKSQSFETLADPIKQQFELHVMAHASALNTAAQNAQMQPPLQGGGMGADNGSGSPLGQPPSGPPQGLAPPSGDPTASGGP